ncbi:MAG: exopolysaccharide biosynthesis polyprenyl glycosylphosphotransferase [Cyanobacteriota bacterium]
MVFPSWGKARSTLVAAAVLDAAGLIALFALLARFRGVLPSLEQQQWLMVILVLTYCTFSWLFGSYTLLKLRRVRWSQVLLRLGATSTSSMVLGAWLEWTAQASPAITLLHRGNLIPAFALMGLWSGIVRWLLRQLPNDLGAPCWLLLACPDELGSVSDEWSRASTNRRRPTMAQLDTEALSTGEPGQPASALLATIQQRLSHVDGLALSAGIASNPAFLPVCELAVGSGRPVITLVELAEQELERIPSRWVGGQWLLFSHRIEAQRSSPNQQLKRYADVSLSLVVLIVTSPLWFLAAMAIRLQDGGPAIYRQQRTGLYGARFWLYKLRSMRVDAERDGIQWSQPDDQRITGIGYWLRRTRIDELPQLINVLRGDMSLIGPRPERPEIEEDLEDNIPNYRLRHWIRPGLSGWAQVNMPYSSSIEDANLKLSYDLYYLRNTSPWLDFLILLKTIKIILKAAGR